MRFRSVLIAFVVVFLACQPALGDDVYRLMMVKDPDGSSNIRNGPSTDFPVIGQVEDGEIVYVFFDRGSQAPESTNQIWIWKREWDKIPGNRDWVTVWRMRTETLDTLPEYVLRMPPGLIHRSRLEPFEADAVAVISIEDSDGFTNLRTGPGTEYEVCGRVTDQEVAYALWDNYTPVRPQWACGWLQRNLQQLEWVKVLNRKGVVGYMHSSRIRVHDRREGGIIRNPFNP
jgi:hypothetical protein